MRSSRLNELKSSLRRHRVSLVGRVQSLEQTLRATSDPDWAETASAAELNEVSLALEEERRTLEAIQAALGRMERGIYGACDTCGKNISLARLRAVPWTTMCVGCREALERKGL